MVEIWYGMRHLRPWILKFSGERATGPFQSISAGYGVYIFPPVCQFLDPPLICLCNYTCIINTVECPDHRSEKGREWGTSRLKRIYDITK